MFVKREIGEKGQVVIPKDMRNYLGLDVGSNIIFEIKGDEIVLKKEDGNASKIVEDFFDTPKVKKKITIKELKKAYEEQYERNLC